MRILIVEDERALAEALQEILKQNHYTADISTDGASGLEAAKTGIYDLMILDRMLPKMDGITVLNQLRSSGAAMPVLMLTALGQAEQRIEGLDAGADDYLSKPFVIGELLARIRALLRRPCELLNDMLCFGDLTLDRNDCALCCGKQRIRLSAKELQLIETLFLHRSSVISREQIVQKIWGFDCEAEYNNVEVYLSFIRRKIQTLGSSVRIKAARGLGYYLEVST